MDEDVEAQQSPLDMMIERNKAMIGELRAMGHDLDPRAVIQLQLDVLIDLLLPEGGAFRTIFDQMIEMNMGGMLAQAKAAVTSGPKKELVVAQAVMPTDLRSV